MPYESFKCSHQLSIRGLVQDRRTGSWRYLIQVRRVMQDADSFEAQSTELQLPATAAAMPLSSSFAKSIRWQRSGSFSSYATASPNSSSTFDTSQMYNIRRSFAEFKLLHAAMKPLMAPPNALPSLPVDSIFAFFVGETQTMLQKKRLALENILIAIESHSVASDATEYLEFLARTDTYEQVSRAPASPPAFTGARSHHWGYSATTAQDASSVPQRYHSDDDQRRHRHRRRRRQSIEGLPTAMAAAANATATEPPATQTPTTLDAAAQENRVDFHRYSMV